MRKCIRCKSEMIEDYYLKVKGGNYGITIATSKKIFADRIGELKVAICPKCGEVSTYIDNIDKIKK